MTDDRARRIREIRNRTTTDASDDEDPSESDVADSDGSNGEDSSGTDDATESNADGTDESTAADESASQSTDDSPSSDDDESATTDDDGSPTALEEQSGTEQQSADSESESESDDQTVSDGETDGDVAATEPPAEVETDESGPTPGAATSSSDASASAGVAAGTTSSGQRTVGAAVATASDDSEDVVEASLQGAIAGMSDTVTVDERVGEATVDATAIAQQSDTYGEAAAGREQVFDRGDSLIASTNEEDTVQMLEFFLDEDRYAIEIERISAIVEMKEITRFPRGPAAIDGVTDLRGEITGVLDPTAMLDIDRNAPSDDHYIVVLEREGDKQKLGIRVTDVSQAVTYRESQIDETGTVMDNDSGDHEFVEGIVKKEVEDGTELVAWLDVDKLIENTEMQHNPGERYTE